MRFLRTLLITLLLTTQIGCGKSSGIVNTTSSEPQIDVESQTSVPNDWRYHGLYKYSVEYPSYPFEIPLPAGTKIESDIDGVNVIYSGSSSSEDSTGGFYITFSETQWQESISKFAANKCPASLRIQESDVKIIYTRIIDGHEFTKIQPPCNNAPIYYLNIGDFLITVDVFSGKKNRGSGLIETALSHLRFTDSSSSSSRQ